MFPDRSYPCDHAMLESVYARILPSRGHEVHWIMRAADHDPAKPARNWHGSTVHTVPLVSGSPLINTRVAIATALATHRTLRGTVSEPFDIVQVRNEIGPSLAALRARLQGRFSFVYQMSFPNAEARLAGAAQGVLRPAPYHWARGHVELIARRWVVRRADAVLAVSDTMRHALLTDRGVSPDRVVAFPLGYDASVDPGTASASARQEIGLADRPLAVYFGTLSASRRLGFLVQALISARRSVPRMALLVIGGDGDVQGLRAVFDREGVGEDVRFLGRLSRRETARYVASADVAVVPIPPTPEYLWSSPTKLLESLGLGVPVVANQEVPEIAAVIGASGGGLLVPYDAEAFGAAMAQLILDPARRASCATTGRAWVQRHRSYEVLAADVEQLYSRLRAPVRP